VAKDGDVINGLDICLSIFVLAVLAVQRLMIGIYF
jgi:hypothetical protein